MNLKAGIRFLKHYAGVLPGDMEKIISVGISAGGAMSTLLGSTGNSENYEKELQRAGAFMEETDDIFGAQCYCPIIDLDHADLAYEWMFRRKTHYTGMPFVGFDEGDLKPFAAALSDRLADAYEEYFNGLGLRHPVSGEPVQIGKGHEGSGYAFMMEKLEESAAKYLRKLERGEELSGPKISATEAGEYIRGCYAAMNFDFPSKSLVSVPGIDKSGWLSWDGTKARIAGLDQMQETYHRRLKLMNTGRTDVDYEIVWDEPHGRADYPGEVTAWVKKICANVH